MGEQRTKSLRLIIDIDVIMESEDDSPDWVVPAVADDPKKEIILGGYWFPITHIEEVPSSAAETVKQRLEYLRGEIRAERISYAEIAELQGLADQIEEGDVELLEWAGVPEFPEEEG